MRERAGRLGGVAARRVRRLERAAGRGELAGSADRSTIIAALLGPLFYHRWFSREPSDEHFIKTIARSVMSSQRATNDSGSATQAAPSAK